MLLPIRRTIILTALFIFHLSDVYSQDLRTLSITDKTCYPKTEICGNGIDEDCSGTDEACLGIDKDADGFTENSDCDDNDSLVHVDVHVGCNSSCGDGHKQCLNTGTFSNCTCDTLCEAPVGSKCYYVDPARGNNNNPGSFEWRKKDLSAFSSLGSAGNKILLFPGDRVYIFGGTLTSKTSNFSNSSIISLIGINGSAEKPIYFTNYPGTFPILEGNSESPSIEISSSKWIHINGLKFTPDGFPISIYNSQNITLNKIYIEDNPLYFKPKIQIQNSHEIKLIGIKAPKSFINTTSSDNILSINNSRITLLNSYLE